MKVEGVAGSDFKQAPDGYPIYTVETAAGIIIRPAIEDIDRMLSSPSDRYMMNPGDVDRLLDARSVLTAAGASPCQLQRPDLVK